MDKITRYEWFGNSFILFLLSVFVFTIPFAVIYLIRNLVQIETQVQDGEALSDYLKSK